VVYALDHQILNVVQKHHVVHRKDQVHVCKHHLALAHQVILILSITLITIITINNNNTILLLVPGYCVGPSDLQCCVSESPSSGTYGIDISVALTSSGATCLASSNSFIIPRGYQSLGKVDPNVCNNLKTAYNAGIKTRDVYLFPCPTCGNPSGQVTTLVNYLNSNCKSYWSGRIWLDIEGSQYWLGSSSSNQAFYKSLKDSCSSNARCGIYSSYYQWEDIFGSTSFVYGNDLPLWYAIFIFIFTQ